jgi:hypothetical protein
MKKELYLNAIKEKGLLKKYIAKQINTHPTQLSRWLNGDKRGGGLTKEQIRKLNILLEIE